MQGDLLLIRMWRSLPAGPWNGKCFIYNAIHDQFPVSCFGPCPLDSLACTSRLSCCLFLHLSQGGVPNQALRIGSALSKWQHYIVICIYIIMIKFQITTETRKTENQQKGRHMSKLSSDCYRNMKQTAGHAPPRAKAPGIPLPLLPKRVLNISGDYYENSRLYLHS